MRALLARVPLRLKLVTAVVALTAVALATISIGSVVALRVYLIDRTDDQLRSVASQVLGALGPERRIDRAQLLVRLGGLRLPSEVVLLVRNTEGQTLLVRSRFDSSDPGPLPDLDGIGTDSDRPATVLSAQGRARWRVLAEPLPADQTLVVAANLADVDRAVSRLGVVVSVVSGVVLAALWIVGIVVVRASLRPLTEIERTAAAIAGGDLGRRIPPSDPRTEVGRLARALNTMLGQIENAFRARASSEVQARQSEAAARSSEERMRRFVADASHELRTPLTTVRGFAELYRQGAVQDAESLADVMRRIEGEAQRMGILVEDLLLLARLDQQRPLAREPVDLAVLANEEVEAARLRGPDRTITLVLDGEQPLTVLGDGVRLRQILANLLDNALRHTPAGTPVEVRLASEPPAAVLEVADRGPGLRPEQAGRVFERFYRADAARGAAGGAGLGLAIVAALVRAHSGSVNVDSEPGEGATFRVRLPLAPGRTWSRPTVSPATAAPDSQ